MSVLENSNDILVISCEFQQPLLIQSSGKTNSDKPQYLLPTFFQKILISSKDRSIDTEIVEREEAHIKEKGIIHYVEDVAVGENDFFNMPMANSSDDLLKEQYLGFVHDKHIFQIGISPYNLVQRETDFQWIKRITLKIAGENINIILNDSMRTAIIQSLTTEPIEKRNVETVLLQKMTASLSNLPKLKIHVDQEGIIAIPQLLLREKGWDITGIDPRKFRIIGQNGEIPIRVIGEEDGVFDIADVIEFYGEPLWDQINDDEKRLDIYSTYNVYWLELGEKNGLRLGQEEAWPQNNEFTSMVYPRSYMFAQHIEYDRFFHRLPYATDVDDGDHWFMASSIGDGNIGEFAFNVFSPDNYATQLVKLCIKLRGQARDLQIHPIEIYINNRRIAQGEWQGNQSIILESEDFSSMYLKEKENILTVINRSEGEFSELLLDWFEITYPRLYKTNSDYIRFRPPRYSEGKICRFTVDGFTQSTVEVYKKGISHFWGIEIETVVDSVGPTMYSVTFQDEVIDENTEYVALTPMKKIIPDSVKLIQADELQLQSNTADYVIIVPADSLGEESLKDLIGLREAQGLQVEVYKLETLYDIFNHGIPNPEAIRRFLRYGYQNWSPAPQYILLIGDGVVNNRASIDEGNLIPAPLYQTTKYGAAPSDYWYTLLDENDDMPDIAIGRIPIRKRKELEAVVKKIVQYENGSLGPWQNRYLLIGAGTKEGVFGNQSEFIIQNILDPSFHPERLYLSGNLSDPYVGGTEDLLRHFREGVGWINFRGHGGGAIWSDAGLLDLDDVELIENKEKLPIVTSMTCFTGDFSGGRESIGEALLTQEETGAVATWGATGLGWTWNDYYLLLEFGRALNNHPDLALGEIINRAKKSYLLTYGIGDLPLSEVHQYTLLGDPALKLTFPSENIDFTLSEQSLTFQDSIHVVGTDTNQNSELLIELTGADRSTQEAINIQLHENQWDVTLPIPDHFTDTKGGVRTYLWDNQSGFQAHGFAYFAIGETFFDSLETVPEIPTREDSVQFSVFAQNPVGFQYIYCQIDPPFQDSLIMVSRNESNLYTTVQTAGPFPSGSVVTYHFVAEDAKGVISESENEFIKIPSLPDLKVQNVSLGGTEHVLLQSKIRNLGEEEVISARVSFECPQISFFAEDTVSLERYGEAIASVPFSPLMGKMNFMVTVDPDNSILENNRGNNQYQGEFEIDRFNVTPELGSLIGMNQPDTVGLVKKVITFLPPGSVIQNTVIHFEEIDHVGNGQSMYQISLLGLEDQFTLTNQAYIQFFIDQKDSIQSHLEPYRWNDAIRRWIRCDYDQTDSVFILHSNTLGLFQMQTSEDVEPPWIEIQAENQSFSDGSYLSKEAHLSAIIQDESGVDIRPEKILVYLDDVLQTSTVVNLPDSSADPKNVMVSIRPILRPGNHQLYICASDIHGNIQQTEPISFNVSSGFEIQYLGNYPNPFKGETTFVYLLTDEAVNVSLKIYTVSGKLIRSFEAHDMGFADYHEIVWDGRDDWGEEVANGVYFFQLKAEYEQGIKEVKNAIAKIR